MTWKWIANKIIIANYSSLHAGGYFAFNMIHGSLQIFIIVWEYFIYKKRSSVKNYYKYILLLELWRVVLLSSPVSSANSSFSSGLMFVGLITRQLLTFTNFIHQFFISFVRFLVLKVNVMLKLNVVLELNIKVKVNVKHAKLYDEWHEDAC